MAAAVLALSALAGAALQRAVGAGYSLVLLPAALLALPDDRAVPCVLAAGIVLCAGLLAAGGPPRGLGRATPVLLAAPVGQLLAVVLLGGLDGTALRLLAAATVAVGCALAARGEPRAAPRATGRPALVTAGVAIGAVGALCGVIGPFLVLVLVALREDDDADELRRRLWLGVATLSASALAITALAGDADAAGALAGGALAPALALGVLLGAPLAAHLPPRRHRRAVLAVAATGAVLLAAGA